MSLLDGNAEARKSAPIASGVLWYFPNALAAIANLSAVGNAQHNPGEPLHWAFDKSTDHADCLLRHLAQAGTRDVDGVGHSVKVAWRALAMLESELIASGATPGRNVVRARNPVYEIEGAELHGDHYYGEHHAAEAPVREPIEEVIFRSHPAQVEEPEGLKAGEAFRAEGDAYRAVMDHGSRG